MSHHVKTELCRNAAQMKFFAIFSTNVTNWITCSVFIANLQRIALSHIRNTFANIFETNRFRFDKQYVYYRNFESRNDLTMEKSRNDLTQSCVARCSNEVLRPFLNETKWITCSVFIANLQRIAVLHIRYTFANIFQTFHFCFDKQYIYCRNFETHNVLIIESQIY